MFYTLGQAAKICGKSKPTLCRAIKTGFMSAVRNADGSYSIDPAELSRAYPAPPEAAVMQNSDETDQMKRSDTDSITSTLQAQIISLGEERYRERQQFHEIIDDLRMERDRMREEREKLFKVLEDQIVTVKQLTYQQPVSAPKKWWKLW